MAKENLDCPDVARGPVDHRRLRSPHRMRSVFCSAQPYGRHPLVDQTRILPGAHVVCIVDPAWKDKVGSRPTAALQPSKQAAANIGGQLELNRFTCLLLHHDSTRSYIRTRDQVANGNFDQITTPELAVYGQIKQRPVPQSTFAIEKEADRPDLLLGQWSLSSNRLARIPRPRALVRRDQIVSNPSSFSMT